MLLALPAAAVMLTRRWASLRPHRSLGAAAPAALPCCCGGGRWQGSAERRSSGGGSAAALSGLAAPKLSTNLSCGLVGLPNVGKSTIFNALTRMQVPAENYPFCTIDPHVGMVEVPDARIDSLRELSQSKKAVPAAMQFVDIAGLVKGASEGAGMGNAFLQNIRDVDAILHLVRCFDSPDVVRADGEIDTIVDPAGDAGVIDTELLLSDLQTMERALAKLKRRSDPVLASTLEQTLAALQVFARKRVGFTFLCHFL
eukprot:COSAG06_NODE_506_length_14931_cov_4.089873_11_plen_256_part_00